MLVASSIFVFVFISLIFLETSSFLVRKQYKNSLSYRTYSQLQLSDNDSGADAPSAPVSKGFGAPKKNKEAKEEVKDAGTMTYEAQQKRGVPEYNIFLRPSNGTEVEWVPVGSMTIPRDTKISKAVFEVEDELLKGTFKLYPKLKAFYDVSVFNLHTTTITLSNES